MTITASVTGAAGTTATAQTSTNMYSNIDSNQFMQLLLVELKHQDPLEPMDSNQMMGQITQLNSLQELQSINGGIRALAEQNDLAEAAALLNTMVSFMADGDLVSGMVSEITRHAGQTQLLIGDSAVPLDSILSVHAAAGEV